ncbi:ATP-binding cassette domain-containing protein [Mariprofundus ferrooxydans]|uniref:ATP-binding cassette domain-containing protein n=1 Tax=Mariprofundus ferrooxydans TaxID=314344 RepID=UPI0003600B54|nr:ATP-binding cassette domain-containing protein [Mariprofundus ferrooxydans]
MNAAAHHLEIRGDEHALRAASGEIILLSGRNGCGKTLWLQRLANLEPLPANIHAVIDQAPLSKQSVRMLSEQWPAIWLGQSIDEEIRFGLNQQPDQQQVSAALSRWGLHDLAAETQVTTLNRLQAIRVSLAAISMATPTLVLLDNPTDALPQHDAATLIADISDWALDSKTIVVVACNRWHDWLPATSQHWQIHSPDLLPQDRGHA